MLNHIFCGEMVLKSLNFRPMFLMFSHSSHGSVAIATLKTLLGQLLVVQLDVDAELMSAGPGGVHQHWG
jgi:hypothetical protein